jgi:hypothetical protein
VPTSDHQNPPVVATFRPGQPQILGLAFEAKCG